MNFISRLKSLAIATVLAGGMCSAAHAHHSGAMFDRSREVVLTGTVKSWQWSNPHTWLVLLTKPDQGVPVEWNLEGQSPGVFRGKGWSRDMINVGDKVTVRISPMKDGTNGGSIVSVTTASGQRYD